MTDEVISKLSDDELRERLEVPPDRLLVRRIPWGERLGAKLIALPEAHADAHKSLEAIVVVVGEMTDEYDGMEFKPGDRVLVGRWAGTEIEYESETQLTLIRMNEVQARIH